MDDELIQEFINESREHLATIEADLLTIEEGGATIDKDLVNKVFRAAHSIKGGSSFFGLDKVKELAHKAETVLDMLRTGKMMPNAEIINVLLSAFDLLREMINNPGQSDTVDITSLVAALTHHASDCLPQELKASLQQKVTFSCDGNGSEITLPKVDFDRSQRANQFIYCANFDLLHDIEEQGKNIFETFRDLSETGEILDCILDFESVGTLEGPVGNQLPLRLIFATIIQPSDVEIVLPVPKKINVLFDPHNEDAAPLISEPDETPAQQSELLLTEEEAAELISGLEPDVNNPPVPNTASAKLPPTPVSGDRVSTPPAEETLRINVSALEALMNLTGELVLGRNQLHAAIAKKDDRSLSLSEQRINLVTSELQDAVMQTRLQPVGNVFIKFPRIVRDMAKALHKQIQIDIHGKEVALDKTLVEGLSDPLMHMVRNAIDHGIEMPAARLRAGKKEMGTIRLEARHEAGHVVVEIADDGKGIDPDRIAQSALSKGLITTERLQALNDQDKAGLIFLPGLSTADQVTDISGRGVGMDVVKTNIERLGGHIETKSEVGKGTHFSIKLPLTLAIIPSLIVSAEREYFAIPQMNIEQLLRVRAEEVQRRIEVIGDAQVLLLRDRLIPLIRFSNHLGVPRTYIDPSTGDKQPDRRMNLADRRSPHYPIAADDESTPQQAAFLNHSDELLPRNPEGRRRSQENDLEIAVVISGTLQYGLVFDHFHNTEEIVVKPLGHHFKDLKEYAGATILGDGTVALILDVPGLADTIDLRSISKATRAHAKAENLGRESIEDSYSLLLFHNAPSELCAAPLDTVLRIEQITTNQVETTGNRRSMQYRGGILPLVTLADTAQVGSLSEAKELAVIVFSVRGREVGLLGAMPVSVTENKKTINQLVHRQTGIAGSTIIDGRTALIVDVFELVDTAFPDWKTGPDDSRFAEKRKENATVLLAEDSDFFRSQVKRFLEEDSLDVLDASDGEEAWNLLLSHVNEVSAVVTDIEMPRLTGLELTQRIRADERTAKLPVIALTTLAGDDDIAKGKAVGIDDYQIKLDRDRLLDRVRACIATA